MNRAISTAIFLLGFLVPGAARASTEKLVHFRGVGGVTIAATLLFPDGKAGCPALLLLAGSGPTDRNGNQPPGFMTDLLKQMAEGLAAKGIATLRFDKRGMYANAADMPRTMAALAHFSTWENFCGDAAAGYRFLREQPGIDTDRIGIIGHSEGGMIALDIAPVLKSEGHPPAVLILVSTPGRPADVVLGEQLRRIVRAQGATPKQTDEFLAAYNRVIGTIRETGKIPGDVPAGLRVFFPQYLTTMWTTELKIDPCKLAADYSGPVLVLAGDADVQVSSERDAKLLDATFAARKGDVHHLEIIPKASHNMKIVANDDDPGIAGPMAPVALSTLQKWAAEQFAKR